MIVTKTEGAADSASSPVHLTRAQRWAALIVYAGLMLLWLQHITPSPIIHDAIGTVVPAVNLKHNGVIALKEPDLPTMYREPLPILVTALGVTVIDAVHGPAAPEEYLQGERAHWLKLQNLFWLTLLCAGAFYVAFQLSGSFVAALVVAVFGQTIFLYEMGGSRPIDTLYTELPVAALLIVASWSFIVGLLRRSPRSLAASGGLFALAALVKAAFLYVAIGLLVIIGILALARRRAGSMRLGAKELAAFAVVFGIVLAPWLYRNWVQFGVVSVSERGGLALYARTLYNDVNAAEYKGSFYVFAPGPLRGLTGRLLGITSSDLEPGGPLFRLNRTPKWERLNLAAERAGRPELATSIVAVGRAERVKLRREFRELGYGQRADVVADNELKARALQRLKAQPLKTLALTVPILWRGGLVLLALFGLTVVHALVRRRYDLLVFCLPAVALTAFYALLTTFEPRYSVPMTAIACIGAGIAAHGEWVRSGLSARVRSGERRKRSPRLRSPVSAS